MHTTASNSLDGLWRWERASWTAASALLPFQGSTTSRGPQPLTAPWSRPRPRPTLSAGRRGQQLARGRAPGVRLPRAACPARWVGAGPPLPAGGSDSTTLARRL